MKANKSYLPLQSPFPALGLDTLEPPSQVDPRYSPAMKNIQIVKGVPTKRLGFQALGGTLASTIIGLVEFENLAGSAKTLLAFTKGGQYKLDPGSSTAAPTWTAMSATSCWTATNNTVTHFDYAFVVGLDGSGNYVKWIVATNGTDDPPVYWDGTATIAATFDPTPAAYITHHTGKMFFNRFVLANVKNASSNPQMISFSDVQKLLTFDGTTSGSIIVPGIQGAFVHAEMLGDRLVLYSDNSIAVMTYVGGDVLFSIEVVTNETRLVSPQAIVNLGPYHLFLSQENIFLFDGSRLMRTMGDKIFREYRDLLATDRASEAIAFHDSAKQQVYFMVPTGASGFVVYVLEYSLENMTDSRWFKYEYLQNTGNITAMGLWSRVLTLTFDSYWAQHTNFNQAAFLFNQGSIKKGFPVRVMAIGNQVYVCDDTMGSDAGTTIDSYWDSVDFTAPQEFLSNNARWIEIELEARGTSMEVQYSIDGGGNFVSAGTFVLTSDFTKYYVPIDVVSNRLRLRLVNNEANGSLSWRWYRIYTRPGGPA